MLAASIFEAPNNLRGFHRMLTRRAREKALIESYLATVSVWRGQDIAESLWDTRVGPYTLSNLNKTICGRIEAWPNQPIEGTQPCLYLDGLVLNLNWAGQARNMSLLVSISDRFARRGIENKKFVERRAILCDGASCSTVAPAPPIKRGSS